MEISLLEQGRIIFQKSLSFSREEVSQYLDAIEDNSIEYLEETKTPPLAILAQVMAEAISEIGLPAGTVHTNQEIEWMKSINLGTTVDCVCTINSNLERNGARFLILEFQGSSNNCLIFYAKTTLVIAAK